jgi:lipoyl(octanoyl) transferase
VRISGLVADLGQMAYEPSHSLQNRLLESVAAGEHPPTLLFVEHPPVFTLGAGFQEGNLLFPENYYREKGIEVAPTDRGGDITFHGPRQLVAYPIFPLKALGQDLHQWLRNLEEAVIRTMTEFELEGYRFPPHTGVWVNGKKACAIGIKVRRWVSKHGIALNCDNDLSPFDLIVPCGIRGYGVTSLSQEAGQTVTRQDAMSPLTKAFEEVFEIELSPASREELENRLETVPWKGQASARPGS